MKTNTYTFECEIEVGENDDIQWRHLPEEIQMYLDSNYENNNISKVIPKMKLLKLFSR